MAKDTNHQESPSKRYRTGKPAGGKAMLNIDHIAMTEEQLEEIDRTIPGLADYIRGWAHKAQNAEETARTDSLTQLPNRLGLEEKASGIFHEMARNDKRDPQKRNACTMGFIDTNDFGLINKAMGDAAGDAAIESVGEYFKKTLRSEDFIARKGGDEFIILMRCPEKDAQKRLQELKEDFSVVATKIFLKKLRVLIASAHPDISEEEVGQLVSQRIGEFQKKLADKHENPALAHDEFKLSFSFGVREIAKSDVEHIDFHKPSGVSQAMSTYMSTADDTMREDKAMHRERMKTTPMDTAIQNKLRSDLAQKDNLSPFKC